MLYCRIWNGFKTTDLDDPNEDDAFTPLNDQYCSEIKDMSSKVKDNHSLSTQIKYEQERECFLLLLY